MTKMELGSDEDSFKMDASNKSPNGEEKLDELIRRIKPSFHRSLSSSVPEVNISNDMPMNENTTDLVARLKGSIPNPEKDEQFSTSTSDVRLNIETVSSKSCWDPKVKFDATTEFFELPFSKERTRIPPKKIIPLKHLPVDSLAKLRKEKQLFSLGFKTAEQSESNQTLSDHQQNHLIALIRLCEAYTKNLGVDYLFAVAKTSVIPQEASLMEGDQPLEWHGGARIVEDPTERLWNWEKSLVNSNLLRDYQGRPIYKKDLDIRYMSQSPDNYQGSLGPNEYDAKSDIGALIIKDSDSSTDVEYDEMDFILANSTHPFADPSAFFAGGIQHSRAQDEYLKRLEEKEETLRTVSQIDSLNDRHLSNIVENKNLQVEQEEAVAAASPLPLGAEAVNMLSVSPQKTPTENTFTSVEPTSTTSTSFEKQKFTIAGKTPSKTIKGEDQTQSKAETKGRSRTRFGRRKRGEKRQRDPIEMPFDFPVENFQCGFENYAVDWCKIITAASAPNPLYWFEAMEAMRSNDFEEVSEASEEPVKGRAVYGLGKRFTSVAGGLDGLYTILKQTVEPDQPKAEVIMDCMVKNYKLQMPLAVGDPVRLRELYINTIVKNPMLYKMVLRRRDILPEDLQALVTKIIEDTESSDAMLAALYPSKTNSDLIVSAAKEMFAPGYLSGGPPCPAAKSNDGKRHPKKKSIDDSGNDSINISSEGDTASSAFVAYGSEVNHEKAFYASLRNPADNILQEVAYHIPEFAFHTRPLFETRWIEIGNDKSYERMLPELGQLRNIRQKRLKMLKLGLVFTEKEEREESARVQALSKELVDRICQLLTCPNRNTSSGIWMGLLASVNGIMFWPPIGDALVSKLAIWIPNLLAALRCDYATVREEVCCLIAFLACCYPFFCRLQTACRNLLISNMALTILDAMDHHPDSYACFHGTLAYILHSIPCNACIDCLLIWIPEIMGRGDESSLARDWPLFFYYVAKHWPSFAIKWNALYDRQIGNSVCPNVAPAKHLVTREDRSSIIGDDGRFPGCTVWFTGLSGAGKSALAFALEKRLISMGVIAYSLDGDNIRLGLNKDLHFSIKDRAENIRRVAEMAKLFADSGMVTLTSFISPFENERRFARELHDEAGLPFLEVYLSTPIEVCEARDTKQLYARARRGEIPFFTGISSPYEPPANPELNLNTAEISLDDCIDRLIQLLVERKIISESKLTGNVCELYASNSEKEKLMAEASSCPHLEVSKLDLQWIQVLAEGWASPLRGFMRETEYLQVLFFGGLVEGHHKFDNLSIPIVLAITNEDRNRLSASLKHITLTYLQKPVAILQNIEFFPHRKEERCNRIFGICDRGHPAIDQIMSSGDWLVGGDLKVFEKIVWNDGLDQYRLSPLQLREQFKKIGRTASSLNLFKRIKFGWIFGARPF
ncbi:hypothetical protein Aperf_G00000114027 [Anoplocephala perfoliata]